MCDGEQIGTVLTHLVRGQMNTVLTNTHRSRGNKQAARNLLHESCHALGVYVDQAHLVLHRSDKKSFVSLCCKGCFQFLNV